MELYPYQRAGVRWILEHEACGLFLEMGLGKTVTTLTAIDELIHDRLEVEHVLVIAPLRVAATVWAEEGHKWPHLSRLRFSKVLGSEKERLAALAADADIYVINRENVPWLVRTCGKRWPFDMVVIDELSSFKSSSAERFKALRRVRPAISRMVGLTGTPAPNGLIDLWAQIYLLDRGQRLGTTLGGYRTRYFDPGRRNQQIVYEWKPKPGAQAAITGALSDLCISMRTEDYLTLPEQICRSMVIPLSPAAQAAYDTMEREAILSLPDGVVTAQTAAVVCGKLLQLANGAIYDENRRVHVVHDAKLDALADVIEAANGHSVLCYYAYQHDAGRIKARFPQARLLETARDVDDWNAGKIPLMLCHPDSAGHGLNLQSGGHIMVWFGLTWSLEKYQQACARLHRNGQSQPVTIVHLIARGTIDEDVMRVLEGKADRQNAVIEAVKARI